MGQLINSVGAQRETIAAANDIAVGASYRSVIGEIPAMNSTPPTESSANVTRRCFNA
jgi:hypothetical protein